MAGRSRGRGRGGPRVGSRPSVFAMGRGGLNTSYAESESDDRESMTAGFDQDHYMTHGGRGRGAPTESDLPYGPGHQAHTSHHHPPAGGYGPYGYPTPMGPYVPYSPYGLPPFGGPIHTPTPNYDQNMASSGRTSDYMPPMPPTPQFSLRLDDSQLQHLTNQTQVKQTTANLSDGLSVKIDEGQFKELSQKKGGGGGPYRSLSAPVYKAGDDWGSFEKEFLNEMELLDVIPSRQLLYLRRAVPEDGQALIRSPRVTGLTEAIAVLKRLYQPPRTSVEIQSDFLEIKQKEGESLRNLAARLQDASNWYDEKFAGMTEDDKENMVIDQFVRAITNKKIQEKLVMETLSSIDQALTLAEKMDRFIKKSSISSTPKSVRLVSETPDTKYQQLREEKELLEARVATLESKQEAFSGPRGRGRGRGSYRPWTTRDKSDIICWWCQEKGHYKNECARRKAGLEKGRPGPDETQDDSGQTGRHLNA